MKKSIFLLALLIGLAYSALSQNGLNKVAVGVKVGIHNSWPAFKGSISIPTGYLQGISSGLQLQYMSRTMLGFETSVLYSTVGWQEPAVGTTYSREINTIEWQINTHLSFGKKRLRLLADAGPYMRFFLNETVNGPADDSLPQYSNSFENNFQYGLFFGGGLGLRLSKFIIQGRGFFHLGLTNFFITDFAVFYVSADRVAGGNLSILIPIGKKTNQELE